MQRGMPAAHDGAAAFYAHDVSDSMLASASHRQFQQDSTACCGHAANSPCPSSAEVKFIPEQDLQTIDALWKAASGGKFGFSAQREIWNQQSKYWSRFFKKIEWVQVRGPHGLPFGGATPRRAA